jgi:septum site-determining protein MinC
MTRSAEPAPDGDPSVSAIQFRAGLYTLMVLRVGDPKDQAFFTQLLRKVAQAPNFYRHAPIVLDLQDLADAPPFNMAELVRRLRQHQLVPIGVQNGTAEQNKTAINAGLSVLPEGREPSRTANEQQAPAAKAPAEPRAQARDGATANASKPAADAVAETGAAASGDGAGTRLVTQPVRSGQQVYADRGDLVVLASISHGAELLAQGHIHVYGTLRGRAVAGATGNTDARIFCHSLEAELVAIAGYYCVREDMGEDVIGKPVQIRLVGNRITIEPLA